MDEDEIIPKLTGPFLRDVFAAALKDTYLIYTFEYAKHWSEDDWLAVADHFIRSSQGKRPREDY